MKRTAVLPCDRKRISSGLSWGKGGKGKGEGIRGKDKRPGAKQRRSARHVLKSALLYLVRLCLWQFEAAEKVVGAEHLLVARCQFAWMKGKRGQTGVRERATLL